MNTGLLEQLNIHPHKPLKNQHRGSIPKQVVGSSDDFLKHKPYESGDRLNRVDWKHYAKTKTVYTRQFGDEQNFNVVIGIDTSLSMSCHNFNKLSYQEELAQSIAYSSLYRGHPVTLVDMGNETCLNLQRDLHLSMANFKTWMGERHYQSKTISFSPSFYEQFKSVLFLCLSDCWSMDLENFTKLQMAMNNDLILIHLLSPDELEPNLSGFYKFIDRESGEEIELKVTPELLLSYHKLFQDHISHFKNNCEKYGFRYFNTRVTDPIKPLLIALGR
jgi:hypothetical protein